MSTPDAAARRERAEKWHERTPTNYGSYETRINAYLCGALEEAEIWSERFDRLQHENDALCGCVQSKHMDIEQKDAEIAALKQNDANREALLDSLLRLRNEHILEIAALREAVSLQGSALREIRIRLHAAGRRPEECYEMSILDDTIAAARRALEETP